MPDRLPVSHRHKIPISAHRERQFGLTGGRMESRAGSRQLAPSIHINSRVFGMAMLVVVSKRIGAYDFSHVDLPTSIKPTV